MVYSILIVLGLSFGSFVNALVWRMYKQSLGKQRLKTEDKKLATQKKFSIVSGRSMCPNCRHELAAIDLIPVLSWLSLRGKCRYCHKPISRQYPAVELATAGLFIISYHFWPTSLLTLRSSFLFSLWLVLLTGFMALIVYDLRWMLLPNRIIYPLFGVAAIYALITVFKPHENLGQLLDVIYSVLIGGGIFYLLFQLSGGRWIGGGDVKLGFLLGLVVGTPVAAIMMIFFASTLGSIISIPLLLTKGLRKDSHVPFGPFLIIATIIVQLFGAAIYNWYKRKLLL